MTQPVRLQLSRKKGFNLQELSRRTNGLAAVKCDRTTKYGNPFAYDDAAESVAMFKSALPELIFFQMGGDEGLAEIRGKNLACWCKADALCHVDVLLELANRRVRRSPRSESG